MSTETGTGTGEAEGVGEVPDLGDLVLGGVGVARSGGENKIITPELVLTHLLLSF